MVSFVFTTIKIWFTFLFLLEGGWGCDGKGVSPEEGTVHWWSKLGAGQGGAKRFEAEAKAAEKSLMMK